MEIQIFPQTCFLLFNYFTQSNWSSILFGKKYKKSVVFSINCFIKYLDNFSKRFWAKKRNFILMQLLIEKEKKKKIIENVAKSKLSLIQFFQRSFSIRMDSKAKQFAC